MDVCESCNKTPCGFKLTGAELRGKKIKSRTACFSVSPHFSFLFVARILLIAQSSSPVLFVALSFLIFHPPFYTFFFSGFVFASFLC